jgi:NADPH2:quinone reductase
MRAAIYRTTGDADVLEVTDIKTPGPGPGQVRVRLHASGINPTDVKSRSGATPRVIDGFQVPHHDGAGVIDAVGAGIDLGRIGERVWVMLAANGNPYGTAADYCIVREDFARSLPAEISFAQGATLGVPALTAAYCLFADGPIEGQQVLVHGGAGGVGRCAVQLARWAGATVVATASTEAKQQVAREAGAHHVLDYRAADAAEQILAVAPNIRRIVEVNITDNLDLDLAVSHPGTVIVVYAADGPDPVLPRRKLMTASVTMEFMLLYNTEREKFARALTLTEQALAEGALTMPPATIYSLEDIAAAHRAQESGPDSRILIGLTDDVTVPESS